MLGEPLGLEFAGHALRAIVPSERGSLHGEQVAHYFWVAGTHLLEWTSGGITDYGGFAGKT